MTSVMITWTNNYGLYHNNDEKHDDDVYDEHDGKALPLAVDESSHSHSGGGPQGQLLLFGQEGVEDGTWDFQSSTDYFVFWHSTSMLCAGGRLCFGGWQLRFRDFFLVL